MPDYSKTRIQFRRGTAAELAAANPKLGVGEPAFATDTNVLKIGDGSDNYNDLSGILLYRPPLSNFLVCMTSGLENN